MNIGDQVIPFGFKDRSQPGTIMMICGNTALVKWIMGSGWGHTTTIGIEKIEKV